jgi:ATP-dependent DNA ligase
MMSSGRFSGACPDRARRSLVKPSLAAQIESDEWTADGHLRHSSFVGLREDKDPREVVREDAYDYLATLHL